MNDYITITQAANILKVSEQTVRNFLLNKKYFKGKRFGRQLRIEKESFQEFVKKAEYEKTPKIRRFPGTKRLSRFLC